MLLQLSLAKEESASEHIQALYKANGTVPVTFNRSKHVLDLPGN